MSGRDRISMLPEHLLEKIFLLLPWEDAARMTVISRTWRDFWAMFRTFNFTFEQKFPKRKGVPDDRWNLKLHEETLDFIKYVDHELSDVRSKRAIIKRFRLYMCFIDCEIASHVDDCIRLVNKNCIKELDLEIRENTTPFLYCLPPPTFSATSLEFLKVKGCKLEKPVFASGRNFCSLREVCLTDISLDDETLHDITFGCPALEYFALINCQGIKVLEIPCLPKLRKLMLHNTETFDRITIEAINLQWFQYKGCLELLSISIAPLECLRELDIELVIISDNLFVDLVSKLPLLKRLAMTSCMGMTRATISHSFLENLVLVLLDGLSVLEIDTPVLRSFDYACARLPNKFSINAPSLRESYLRMNNDFYQCLNTRWFLAFRDYLSKFDQHNRIVIFLPFTSATFIPDEFKNIEIPTLPVVKQLNLEIFDPRSSHQALLDGLLWSCHPDILATHHTFKENARFIRFLCKEMIDRVEDPLCCMNSRIRCWRHFLRRVRTESLTAIEDRDALLSSLPERGGPVPDPGPGPEISFQLQWI